MRWELFVYTLLQSGKLHRCVLFFASSASAAAAAAAEMAATDEMAAVTPLVLPMALTAVSDDAARSRLHATAPPPPMRDFEVPVDGVLPGFTWTGVKEMNLGTDAALLVGSLTRAPLAPPPPLATRTTPVGAATVDSGDDGGVMPPAPAAG